MRTLCLTGALRATLGAGSSGSQALTSNGPAAAPMSLQGVPAADITVGSAYSFTPGLPAGGIASAKFAIEGLPAWAHFDASTGTLSGTPTMAAVGVSAGITILASEGADTGSLGPFTIRVNPQTVISSPLAVSNAPGISGNPGGVAIAGRVYTFTPTASDPGGDPLVFSVQNAPGWATLNSVTGELSGTPSLADLGTFAKITLSVADGTHSASLAQFSIVVTETAQGQATLTWVPPAQNTDGTALTNLAGYRIYYGSQANSLTLTIEINNPGTTDYVVGNLTPGTWYFAISALTSAHAESAESAVQNAAVM